MRKAFSAVCIAALLAVQTAFFSVGAVGTETAELFSHLIGQRGAADFYDGLEYGGSVWAAYCYARLNGTDGAESYIQSAQASAEELISSEGFVLPTELQKAAVALSAYGKCSQELIDKAAYSNESLDRQGLNAWIWALIAANCSGLEPSEDALHDKEGLAEHILDAQLEDGGFSLFGESSDTDMTSAAIYALAPMADGGEISAALDRAAEALSGLQLESGGFMSMGVENCESTAQAIIAFTSLGLDESDARITRAAEALGQYKRQDGGYAHISDGGSNASACVQALEAYTALTLEENNERLFDLPSEYAVCAEGTAQALEKPISGEAESAFVTDEITQENAAYSEGGFGGFHIKLIICCTAGAAACALAVTAIVMRRGRLLAGAGVCVLCAGGVWLLDIKTADEYYSAGGGEGGLTVTVSADCSRALSHMDDIDESINPVSVIPEDGVIIGQCEVELTQGATAFDALAAAAREQRVRIDYTGSVYGVYISGIGFVYEFGFGDGSGWLYRVNGELPNVSAGSYTLDEGDVVEFIYTCELGADM